SATKALTGHSLGATGVQEAIYSLLMLNNGFICESAHITELDPVFADMPIVRKRIDNARIGTVMSNSFGFGGTNATLVFKRLDAWRVRGAAGEAEYGSSNNDYVKIWVKRGARLARTFRVIQNLPTCPRHQDVDARLGAGMTEVRMTHLMQGKRGLIMGVANDHSIAWGIAKTLAAHGAELAFTYQGEALAKRVRPLAESVGASLVLPCDVEDIASVDKVFADIGNAWGKMDFLVHAIA